MNQRASYRPLAFREAARSAAIVPHDSVAVDESTAMQLRELC